MFMTTGGNEVKAAGHCSYNGEDILLTPYCTTDQRTEVTKSIGNVEMRSGIADNGQRYAWAAWVGPFGAGDSFYLNVVDRGGVYEKFYKYPDKLHTIGYRLSPDPERKFRVVQSYAGQDMLYGAWW